MTDKGWAILAREEVFAVRPYAVVSRERIRTDAGVVVDDFYEVALADFAVCVPQLATGEIVTLWQYKHGPRRFGLGFPAGFIDPGEAPDAACRRELLEETGYAPCRLDDLGSYVDNGNQRGSFGHYFFAAGCSRVTTPQPDDLETIEIRLMQPAAIDAALAQGQFSVIHHVAAWALARPRIA
jgi:ADP-ribose pyrophosphatase